MSHGAIQFAIYEELKALVGAWHRDTGQQQQQQLHPQAQEQERMQGRSGTSPSPSPSNNLPAGHRSVQSGGKPPSSTGNNGLVSVLELQPCVPRLASARFALRVAAPALHQHGVTNPSRDTVRKETLARTSTLACEGHCALDLYVCGTRRVLRLQFGSLCEQ